MRLTRDGPRVAYSEPREIIQCRENVVCSCVWGGMEGKGRFTIAILL